MENNWGDTPSATLNKPYFMQGKFYQIAQYFFTGCRIIKLVPYKMYPVVFTGNISFTLHFLCE